MNQEEKNLPVLWIVWGHIAEGPYSTGCTYSSKKQAEEMIDLFAKGDYPADSYAAERVIPASRVRELRTWTQEAAQEFSDFGDKDSSGLLRVVLKEIDRLLAETEG